MVLRIKAFWDRYEGFVKYFFASGLSLTVDYASYILLVKCGGLALPAAAAAGYSIGLVFAYFLISRKVFTNGWLREFRKTEFMLFLVSGAIGVGLTYGTSFMVVALLGNMLNTAKLMSVAVSFICVYIFRKHVVFSEKWRQ